MIVVMVITAIVVTLAASLFRAGFTNYNVAANNTALTTQASIAMARISKELQRAVSFSATNATNVTFATVDGSTITYNWASPTITRTGNSVQILNNKVTSFSLSYYQSDFTLSDVITDVVAVTISMTLSNGVERVPLINTVFINNM
jgi:hypothetical protein